MQFQDHRYFVMLLVISCLISIKFVSSFPFITRCSGKAANMIFVLDSSTSVWIVDYKKQLKFVEKLVEPFDIGPADSQVHVGAITFSSHAHLEFSLDKYTDKEQLKRAISSIPYRQGQTNTAEALSLVRMDVSSHLKTSTAPFIVVVITDGMSSNTKATRKQAKKLHKLGVNVYAIGVGYYYHLSELYGIASRPKNVYTVSSYSALESIVKTFNIKSCKDIEITTTPKPTTTTTTTTPTPTIPPTTTTTTPAPTTTTTTTPAPTTTTTTAPTTTTTTTPAPTTTTTTAPTTTTTTTPIPTTTTMATTATTTTLPPTTTTTTPASTTTTEEPTTTSPEPLQRDDSSTVSFGYDLVSMGAYRAHIIQQFIDNLLPYTDYGHFAVVSYAYCPENFNVPVTSLMDKKPSDIGSNVTSGMNLPTLADVVNEMRKELNERAVENTKKGLVGNQIAVLFVDPSVTAITSDLLREAGKLKQDGSKLFLISIGESASHQSQYLHSLSSQPFKKYILSYPTYDQLLTSVKNNPSQFNTIATKSVPAN